MKNILYIAAAGSGKTTILVKSACEVPPSQNVLLLTYTDSNEKEIRKKFYQEIGFIPKNVEIQSWFSFLIEHFIKPYQNYLTSDNFDIKGIAMLSTNSGAKKSYKIPKANWEHYYFTNEHNILSEKIGELAYNCNDKSNGMVIERITNIFENIYIDEVQDLAGYDLEIIRIFFLSKSNVILAGDPRQTIYLTNHNGNKNKSYRDGKILDFLQSQKELKDKYIVDNETLNGSYRCCSDICNYASLISKNFEKTVSLCDTKGKECGVYLVRNENKIDFLNKYVQTSQLRYRINVKGIDEQYECMNFGESKGKTFECVLIYPTKEMERWIENHSETLAPETRNKFYVAVTRAKYLVGIVWSKKTCTATDIQFWRE